MPAVLTKTPWALRQRAVPTFLVDVQPKEPRQVQPTSPACFTDDNAANCASVNTAEITDMLTSFKVPLKSNFEQIFDHFFAPMGLKSESGINLNVWN